MAVHHEASSSSSYSGWSFEVFLSFHGKDVRTNFADFLFQDLVGAGIRTFRDDEELSKGNVIGPDLLAAIEQSIISIPIFSKNYASSKWCLNEVKEISECKTTRNQIVYPIFYKVEPTDVRNQTGGYAKAFKEHHKRFDKTTVQKWRNALKDVGKLDGWHSKEDTYEGKLVKEVVKKVWNTLNKRLLHVSNKLVGIQSHIEEMVTLLDIKSGTKKIVGIHGLGGIGKTTIARVVYNTILAHFEGYTFIENVRENAEKHGIHYLQNQLIKDVLKQENPNITNVDTGIKVIQQRFHEKKVLLILDDVEQDIQVKSLAGDREWFGIGSRIIITSRNKDILIAPKTDAIYEPKVMAPKDSLKLFSHYAFGRDWPLEDYLDLSKAIVKTTGGLPLALQVIGSSLFKKEISIWKCMLKKLQKFPNNDVMKSLKISYDGLEDAQQQMFLDTACFFIGMNKEIACHIWEGCGFYSQVELDVLCVKSLIMISEDGKLRMHDILRDLGRDIVRQESITKPGERSRIWFQEEVLDVLVNQMGTSKCEGLSIDFSSGSRSQCLMSDGFAAMTELRLLQLDHVQSSGNITNSFSELRWLSWRGCPDQFALTNFCPQNLAVLDLSNSEITENWMGWNCIKKAGKLKVLNLTSCHQLSSIPDISKNELLEVLILEDCENLVWLDASIGYLRNLVTLNMSDCKRLVDLPIEICQLTSLEKFYLMGCVSLNKLPKELGCMISLTTLHISSCVNLKSLPNLPSSLKCFGASGCTLLRSFPILSNLKNLELVYLDQFMELVDFSSLPSSLTSLNISRCNSIKDISGLPSSLTTLNINRCDSIQDISCLPSSLTSLNINRCDSIQDISGLPSSLTSLNISECVSIQGVSCLSSSFTSLNISECISIRDISGLPSSLASLNTSECTSILDISGLPSSLKSFNISRCDSIQGISGLPSSLKSFHISRCDSIEDISGLPSSLTSLNIMECNSIRDISCLSSTLTTLNINRCNSIENISCLSLKFHQA